MKTLIIADIGSNHLGDMDRIKILIDECKWAGADVAKFQAICRETYTSEEEWHKRKECALNPTQMIRAAEVCEEEEIEFMVTPSTPRDVERYNRLVKRWKIASADLGYSELIEAIRDTGKETFWSQGVTATNPFIGKAYVRNIPLLCVSKYPAQASDYAFGQYYIDGSYIHEYDEIEHPWGLSDHTLSTTLAVGAVALGACVIEKHIRSYNQPPSPDKNHSLNPAKFKSMVEGIREIEQALSNTQHIPSGEYLEAKGRKVWK